MFPDFSQCVRVSLIFAVIVSFVLFTVFTIIFFFKNF